MAEKHKETTARGAAKKAAARKSAAPRVAGKKAALNVCALTKSLSTFLDGDVR